MPNKYAQKKGWTVPKQRYLLDNWSGYNQALRSRGDIEMWITDEAIESWFEKDRVYDGTGAPKEFTNLAITICHELRLVYRLPLRQCQGFIDSLFRLKKLNIRCPDYTTLCKRLAELEIGSPRYKKTDKPDSSISALVIDSTGLKRFGRDEWHQEKHKVLAKRSWRKLHLAVDMDHIIQGATLTDRFVADDQVVETLAKQVTGTVEEVMADGAYDKTPVYETLCKELGKVAIIIPPDSDAVYNAQAHPQRNQTLTDIKSFGRMVWQRVTGYGKRNYSELAIQRYKKLLGNQLHGRELTRQHQEVMLGCGVLNKMTKLGMPESHRFA
jgi:hypothetical protein